MSTDSDNSLRPVRTILRGFLLGIGFMLAAGIGSAILYRLAMHEQRATMDTMLAEHRPSPDSLTLSDIEELKHDGLTSIIGTVKNAGSSDARGIQIQVEFFSHNKFVDQYSTYISGRIAPGESKHFKISCGCKDSPPAEHDSFKVDIVKD